MEDGFLAEAVKEIDREWMDSVLGSLFFCLVPGNSDHIRYARSNGRPLFSMGSLIFLRPRVAIIRPEMIYNEAFHFFFFFH